MKAEYPFEVQDFIVTDPNGQEVIKGKGILKGVTEKSAVIITDSIRLPNTGKNGKYEVKGYKFYVKGIIEGKKQIQRGVTVDHTSLGYIF